MASSVLSNGEPDENTLQKVISLGLGIGVDMTDPKPWTTRGSYYVYRLTNKGEVIVFDEGGSWLIHENVISSRTDRKTKLHAGFAVPDVPAQIQADAEYSQSSISSQKTYGRRLMDCKASIRPDHIEAVGDETYDTFEKRLSKWVLTKFKHYSTAAKVVESDLEMESVDSITDSECHNPRLTSVRLDNAEKRLMVEAHKHAEVKENVEELRRDLLVALCLRFIKRFRATHFVHTLELGVLEYRVEEETRSTTTKGGGVGMSAAAVGSAGASATAYWEEFSNHKQTIRIGVYDEKTKQLTRPAVVSVDVFPITSLVKSHRLRLALQAALNYYVDERHAEEESEYRRGPFTITFEDDSEFYGLKVSERYTLEASKEEEDWAPFYLVKSDTADDEIHIVYYGTDLHRIKAGLIVPNTALRIPYYLEANPSFLGNHAGPLNFKSNTDSGGAEYRFSFEEQMNGKNGFWHLMEGEKLFYIRCPRKWRMASYLYFAKTGSDSDLKYRSGCTHTKNTHNQTTAFMLFRLQMYQGNLPSLTASYSVPSANLNGEPATDM